LEIVPGKAVAPENRAGVDAAKAAIQKRQGDKPAATPAGGRPVSGTRINRGNQLSFFSEDAPGLKISPKTVLIMSLFFLGAVVFLHIIGKVRPSGDVKENTI